MKRKVVDLKFLTQINYTSVKRIGVRKTLKHIFNMMIFLIFSWQVLQIFLPFYCLKKTNFIHVGYVILMNTDFFKHFGL